MTAKHHKSAAAVTLVEVMLASVVIVVGFIGATSYRYYAALDERKATMWRTAARVGLLFADSWRGLNGLENYEPVVYLDTVEFDVEKIADGPIPDGYSAVNGTYAVTTDEEKYYVTLAYGQSEAELRALNIEVAWTPRLAGETDFANAEKSFKLTMYVPNVPD